MWILIVVLTATNQQAVYMNAKTHRPIVFYTKAECRRAIPQVIIEQTLQKEKAQFHCVPDGERMDV